MSPEYLHRRYRKAVNMAHQSRIMPAPLYFGWRPVSPRRANALRKRGEDVRYLPEVYQYAWMPKIEEPASCSTTP